LKLLLVLWLHHLINFEIYSKNFLKTNEILWLCRLSVYINKLYLVLVLLFYIINKLLFCLTKYKRELKIKKFFRFINDKLMSWR
jgi:hypothetical protein